MTRDLLAERELERNTERPNMCYVLSSTGGQAIGVFTTWQMAFDAQQKLEQEAKRFFNMIGGTVPKFEFRSVGLFRPEPEMEDIEPSI